MALEPIRFGITYTQIQEPKTYFIVTIYVYGSNMFGFIGFNDSALVISIVPASRGLSASIYI